jgi:hypothetical protein
LGEGVWTGGINRAIRQIDRSFLGSQICIDLAAEAARRDFYDGVQPVAILNLSKEL